MSDDRYDKTTHDGKVVDKYTKQNLVAAEKKLGYALTIVQGSYHKGVGASAGTHDGGGVVDLAPYDQARKVRVLRDLGFAAWYRPTLRGVWSAHIHAVLIGNTKASASAKAQVTSYKNGRNGLANNARDTNTYRPSPIVNAKYSTAPDPKPFTVRVATYNLPGADKLPNPAARLKAGVKLVKTGTPDLIGWNELVGIKRPGYASDFAHDVDAALGTSWGLVKPTLPLNENYISYNTTTLALVRQYPDHVLPSKSGGRHLTVAVFRHKATGRVFVHGQTHLVNGSTAANEADRQLTAELAGQDLRTIAGKHGDCPAIVGGDVNTAKSLFGFLAAGLANVRPRAKVTTNRNAATYTNIAKTKPSTNTDWIIDQIACDKDAIVNGYTVLLGVGTDGEFTPPRPSDHVPIVASIHFP